MKLNFKKISAIAGSVLMTGLTMGTAMAASFPTPFVQSGTADVAIVYGAGATLDVTPSTSIKDKLAASVTGGAVTIDGESYKFEKTSTKFHLGDTITGVISSSLDDDELPTLLADGKYIDNDNDEIDYTQKITMQATQLTMFEDNDYKADEPTVGFHITSGSTVLTYQLSFTDSLLLSDTPTTNLPLMGKTYYVLSNTSTTMTLLDTASETVLSEGESKTLSGKTVSVEYIGDTSVKLTIDGETTNSLAEGGTFKLKDGSYVGIKDIMYVSKDSGVSKVEFSLGSGKLVLTDGGVEVQLNDQAIPGVESDFAFSSGETLSNIEITWKADEDLFITEESSITMPGFEIVSLSFTGLEYPAEESIKVGQGGDLYATLEDFPLKDGLADINFLYADTAGTFSGLGKDSDNRLVTAASGANLTFDQDTDDYFVVSWSDGSDAESYLTRFNNFVLDGSDNKTTFQYYSDGSWVDKKTGVKDGDEISIGNAEIKVYDINRLNKNLTVANNSANTNFNMLYSKEGLTVYLPVNASSTHNGNTTADITEGRIFLPGAANASLATGHNATSFYLVMKEEDKNGNKAHADGDWINLTIGWDSSSTPEVEVSAVNTENADATSTEIGSTDIWRDFTYSALATEILYSKPSSGQKSVKLIYHGDEVAAGVYITSPDAVTSSSNALGNVLYTDTQIESVKAKNLIVVGGSCINSVAADLLGGAYCGPEFTTATGISNGEALLKAYPNKYTNGKVVVLVAGYEAADTQMGATYLINKNVDTSTVSSKVTTVTNAVDHALPA